MIAALDRARLALEGTSLGDAFGERFFCCAPQEAIGKISRQELPEGPWKYTDDAVMACAVFEALRDHGEIDKDHLAHLFARNYQQDIARGYGGGAHRLLQRFVGDGDWFRHATALFRGEGSFGNGAAMRVAPLGAYFAGDAAALVEQAHASALVTHAHKDGRAGAVAVALAAGFAWECRGDADRFRAGLFDYVLEHTPEGQVRDGVVRARNTPATATVHLARSRLGNGSEISAVDTVPFTLWSAHRHIDDFVQAMWTTVSALGDRDTTCAIVGGIVALFVGHEGLPEEWIQHRESLGTFLTEPEASS